VDFDPVFIIGDHRSGTTVLYQALARTGAFTVVTAYHVIRDRDIVPNYMAGREDEARRELADELARRGLTDRIIDGTRVTPDLPEEYGFVIDKAPRPRLRPSTLPALLDLCARLRLTGGDRPVLLKNPWDVLNFEFVKQSLPRARLIFVHRHPLAVMSSQLAATRSLLAARNEYVAMLSPWYRRLFDQPLRLRLARAMSGRLGPRVVSRHVKKATRYYVDHIDAMPAADYVEVRYEDLCAAPAATIARVLEFLRLPTDAAARAAEVVHPRGAAVLPEVLERYRQVGKAMSAYRRRHKYEMEEVS
jgi:hypothetical protein